MWTNVKIIVRRILRQKLYSAITIGCLTMGMAVALLTAGYAVYELNYEQFGAAPSLPAQVQPKSSTIYRMKLDYVSAKESGTQLMVQDNVIGMVERFPEVEWVCRVNRAYPGITYGKKPFRLDHLITTDENFFRAFPVKAVRGTLTGSLRNPRAIVLTSSLAQKISGRVDMLGETVSLGPTLDYVVSAVIEDWPRNSHLEVEALVPNEKCPFGYCTMSIDSKGNRSTMNMYEVYLQASSRADLPALSKKLGDLFSKVLAARGIRVTIGFTPLQKIYMSGEASSVATRFGDMNRIYLLVTITVLTLFIAGVNYVNLTNARSSRRAREIGVKKTLGAGRFQLFREFMLESLTLTILAAMLAVGLAWLLLPLAQRLLMTDYSLNVFFHFPGMLFLALGILLTGLLAGFYPALVLSRFQPLTAILSGGRKPGRFLTFGRILIVFQFAISVALIIGALVISRQLDYISSLDLGYRHENLLHVRYGAGSAAQRQLLQNRLLADPAIEAVAFSRGVPNGDNLLETEWKGEKVNILCITPEYVPTLGMSLAEGRNILPGDAGRACLLNEVAARRTGPGSPIGKWVNGKQVVGVVRNFRFQSAHAPVKPVIMDYESGDYYEDITIRLRPGMQNGLVARLETLWRYLMPGVVLDHYFFDDRLESDYRRERRLGELIRYAAGIAILMSCFGLVGLALFEAESRKREIGVRKVFGASAEHIVLRLTRRFLVLVGVAVALACPVAWYVMQRWLSSFACRTELGWSVFALSGALALVLAALTVSAQVCRSALINPVETLRQE